MINFYDKINSSRSLLNYDIDGIVYKIDSIHNILIKLEGNFRDTRMGTKTQI